MKPEKDLELQKLFGVADPPAMRLFEVTDPPAQQKQKKKKTFNYGPKEYERDLEDIETNYPERWTELNGSRIIPKKRRFLKWKRGGQWAVGQIRYWRKFRETGECSHGMSAARDLEYQQLFGIADPPGYKRSQQGLFSAKEDLFEQVKSNYERVLKDIETNHPDLWARLNGSRIIPKQREFLPWEEATFWASEQIIAWRESREGRVYKFYRVSLDRDLEYQQLFGITDPPPRIRIHPRHKKGISGKRQSNSEMKNFRSSFELSLESKYSRRHNLRLSIARSFDGIKFNEQSHETFQLVL